MSIPIVCLTPVRNEAWILDTFLKSASIWADYIIIADQNSTDGSRDIVSNYPKAIMIDYDSSSHSQIERRRMLIDKAREVVNGQTALLMAIDADEVLSPEVFSKETWNRMLECKPGTVFNFQWATLFPNSDKYWMGYFLPYGFMDDGSEYIQRTPHHGTRLPVPDGSPTYDVSEFKVIHFQYMNPERNTRRQRWYQCLELDSPSIGKDAIDIYRKYHFEQLWSDDRIKSIPSEWIKQYADLKINLLKTYQEDNYWYDDEVKKLFDQYGYKHFKKLDIWSDVFKSCDPRGIVDKVIHFYLQKTQKHYYTKMRTVDNIVKRITKY